MTLHLHSSPANGHSCRHGCVIRVLVARSLLRSTARHAVPTLYSAFQPLAGSAATRKLGINSPPLTQRRPLYRQPIERRPDRDVSQQAELLFDYWCADLPSAAPILTVSAALGSFTCCSRAAYCRGTLCSPAPGRP
jgi:hypothetical protein